MRYRDRLVLLVSTVCLLLLFNQPALAQDVPEPQVIPVDIVHSLSVSGRTIVWNNASNPITGDILALRVDDLQVVSVADGPTIQDMPATNGEIVIWRERPEGPGPQEGPASIKGYRLATGETFVITENLPSVRALAMDGDLVGWVEETGAQQWRVMARNIGTLEPAFEVVANITSVSDTAYPLLRLHVSGTAFFWYENSSERNAPRSIMFRDISTMDAPQPLVTINSEPRFVDNWVIWWDEQRQQYYMQPGDAEPRLLTDDILFSTTLNSEHAVYIGEQGLTEVRFADGSSRVLDSNVLVGSTLASNGSQTCWEQNYAGYADERLFCHDHGQQRTIELPFTAPEGEAVQEIRLIDDSLLWTTSSASPRSWSTMHVVSLSALFAAVPPAAPPPITEPAFQQLWERYDRPVVSGASQRSWTWGPDPLTPNLRNPYRPELGGEVGVIQYFDKARMEINDPTADPNDPWYVTTGLLPVELITGDSPSALYTTGGPARLAAVGDPGSFPSYADLGGLFDREGSSPADTFDQPITARFQPDGTLDRTGQQAFAADPNTTLVASPTGADYGVPQAFATFMNQYQPDGEQGFDPLFVFGLPVTEAVWVDATVGDVETPVLVQVFERRVLTYNPANPPAFQVEMGNVGRHYLQWRGY